MSGTRSPNILKKSLRCMLENPNTENIQDYLDIGGNINVVHRGTTVLCELARKDQTEIIQWLLSISNANVNLCDMKGCSPLYIAASHGLMDTVRLLLEHGAHTEGVFGILTQHSMYRKSQTVSSGYTPLVSAIQNNHMECACLLIENGANVNVTWQNLYQANLYLFTQVLFSKHDPELAMKMLKAGVRPYTLMKPLVFMLMQDDKVTFKFIRTMIAAGFRLPIEGYRDLCKLGQLDSTPEQEEIMTFLEHVERHPLTLYEYCRMAVRMSLCRHSSQSHMSHKIALLYLPSNIRKFVELDENYL